MTNASPRTSPVEVGILANVAAVAEASVDLVGNVFGHVAQLVTDIAVDSTRVAREVTDLWDLGSRHAATLGDAVRAAPRFTRLATEILRLVAVYRWHGIISGPRTELLGADADAEALAILHARNAGRLYDLCVEMRGGVLKLGQFVSSRMDLLPDAYVASLSRLQDRVPPVSVEEIRARIHAELAHPPEMLFASFAADPLAAASLAQVHAAALDDGTPVVVKAQVPGIEEVIEVDIAVINFVLPALSDLVPFADLDTVTRALTTALRTELDYESEARHAAAFTACLAGDPDVIVPRVYPALSSQRVLTLERIRGDRLIDYLDACEARGEDGANDRDRLFSILLRTFCAMVLEHGLLHADPHPGNFLVVDGTEGPRLALLDFGCVQSYTPARRRAYAELALAVLSDDTTRLAELFDTMGFRGRNGRPDALRAFADMLLEAFRQDRTLDLRTIDAEAAFARVLQLTRANPIVAIPTDFVLLARVFAVLGGLLLRYRPRVNLFQILMPHLIGSRSN